MGESQSKLDHRREQDVAIEGSWKMERKSVKDILLTVPQAALRLGIAEKTCWAWLYSRRLPVTRFGNRCVRISSAALDEMIADATIPVAERE